MDTKDDKDRIPEIDILVENNQIWKRDNFEAQKFITFQVTLQVILLFIFLKKKKFLQGILYFLLVVVEFLKGTYEQMFNSLK